MELLLAVHLAATLFMTGLIWFVQVVHYPLFPWVPSGSFPAYEAEHTRRTTFVVGPVMLVELGCALALLGFRPAPVPIWATWAGVALLTAVWLVTFFVSLPQHGNLAKGYDPAVARALVQSNWLRTIAWSARAIVALAMVLYWR